MNWIEALQDKRDRDVDPLHKVLQEPASGIAPEATYPTEAGKASA